MRTWLLSRPVILACFALATTSAQAQTWTTINQAPPEALDLCLLLTDASVMCQGRVFYNLANWYKFIPDLSGNYANGTWSAIASMPAGYGPLAFASAVLADGRVVVVGGDYNNLSYALTNMGAIYDPQADTWTMLAAPPSTGTPNHFQCIGNAPSVVLADGRFLIGSKLYQDLAILDPATLSWSLVSATGKIDAFNAQEGWTLLPDGSVFTLDVQNAPASERFLLTGAAAGFWTSAGNTPQDLQEVTYDPGPLTAPGCPVYYSPGSVGPTPLLPDGTVFAIGADGFTAIYTPPAAGSSATGTWSEGPPVPGLTVQQGPAAVLPSGHVLFGASPPGLGVGLQYFEFDGVNLISVPAPGNAAADVAESTSLLVLPTGQVLFVDGSTTVQLYSPAATPTYNPAWAPTIGSVPPVINAATTYAISGTQFNGLNQGTEYGPAFQNATNYPLVRITNSATGEVFYARTHDHSTMGVATGSATVSTNFDVPANIVPGAATLQVIANGIPSAPTPVTVTLASSGEPPTVTTGSARDVTSYSATLDGTVSPDGADTQVWFEYSTNSSMAGSLSTPPQDVGSGTNVVNFSITAAGLAGNTTYYFQAWASNSAGTAHGSIGTFIQFYGPQGYSTFGPNNSLAGVYCAGQFSGNVCEPTNPPTVIAAPFTLDSALNLRSITLAVYYSTGPNAAQISLLQDAGGNPGAALETWQVSNLPTYLGALTTVNDQLGLALAAGQQYWVAVQAPAADPDTLLVWSTTPPYFTEAFSVIGVPGALTVPSVNPGGVVSASAFGGFTSVAPGSWIEIYGSNLAPGTVAGPGWNGPTAPMNAEGTAVTIGGQFAFFSFVSPNQIDVQVPPNVAPGPQPLIVITEAGGASSPYTVNVNALEPGLLAPPGFKLGGNQYVAALFSDGVTYVLPTGAIPGISSHPAHPGDTITLYGIGFGAVTPGVLPGQLVLLDNTLTAPFHLFFGSTEANVTYDGLAPYYVGLYQFNVVVPQIPGGNLVPLTFTLAGTSGVQTLYIAVE